MKNLFEMIYEYQLLRGKQDRLDVPLDEVEKARLAGLEQLLSGDAIGTAGRRGMTRVTLPKRVLFTTAGGFETGDVKNLSGSGLAIATRRPPDIGTRIVVRVEEAGGVEYFFPCRVVWRRLASNVGMGVAFDGVPTRSQVFGEDESSGIWQSSIRLGDAQKRVAAA